MCIYMDLKPLANSWAEFSDTRKKHAWIIDEMTFPYGTELRIFLL